MELSEDEKWKLILKRRDEWYAMYTNQVEDSVIEEAVEEIYRRAGWQKPYLFIVDDPRQAALLNAKLVTYHEHSKEVPKMPVEEVDKYLKKHKLKYEHRLPEWSSRHLKLHWECARAGWLSTYDIAGVDLPVDELNEYTKWVTAIETMFCYSEVCIASRKPIEVKIVDNELSCEDGPAVTWRSGQKAYCINGVILDEQIVMAPETQTLRQIDEEENVERQRLRIERYGWERYLTEKKAKVIDQRKNEIEGTYEALVKCGEMRVLLARCPSKVPVQVYALEVDPSCKTCKEAQDYLCGRDSSRIIART